MGRTSEFHGGAYGNFEPEPVDLDLSDKVTDHPHMGELGPFHDPDTPLSKRCLEPGCGRLVNEHRSQYLPPTRAGYEMMQGLQEGQKAMRREANEKAAWGAHNEEQAMKTEHGTAPHFISGKGWINEPGPTTKKEFRKHLQHDHYVHKEDVKEMEDPAQAHARWHANKEYGGEEHHHHTQPKRYRAED